MSPRLRGKDTLATFLFVCEDPERLAPGFAKGVIERVLTIAGDAEFVSYLGLVEFGPSAMHGVIPDLESPEYPPGHAVYATLAQAETILEEKYEHEKPEYRKPGHQSTVAPEALQSDACILVIGSREFLTANAELYLERRGPLRGELLRTMRKLSGLHEASRVGWDSTKPTFYPLTVSHPQFYPGNFNALWRDISIKRMKTREMLMLVGADDANDLGQIAGIPTPTPPAEENQ